MATEWTSLTLSNGSTGPSAEAVFVGGAPREYRGSENASARARDALATVNLGGRAGEVLCLAQPDGGQDLLVLIVGQDGALDRDAWLAAGGHLFAAMQAHKIDAVRLPASERLGGADSLHALLQGAFAHSYRLKGGRQTDTKSASGGTIVVDEADLAFAERVAKASMAVNRARAWVDQPANLLMPPVFAHEAEAALGSLGAAVRIYGPAELQQMGAGLLVAVGRGSEFGAHLFVAEWRGDPDRETWDAVLVGKGLTFDAGGLNLKARPIIAKMKLDMGGGAAVLAALEMAIVRESKANIVAIVPMTENNIDALGYRPGDVLRSLSGLTVAVADTDAEGRLALADAMTFGLREYRPEWLIDIATLTGQVVGTLHEEFAALFTSDELLASSLLEAGDRSGDRLWRLPLDKSQDYLVESEQADVSNLGAPGLFGNGGGSPVAGAKFLEKFAGGTRWAHIDMAGTVIASRATPGRGKGATGYGARLLDRWISTIEAG